METERNIPSPISFLSQVNYYIDSQQGEQPDVYNDTTVIQDETIPGGISLEGHHVEDQGRDNPDQQVI